MPEKRPNILGFAAYSGTGKTTLLVRLIPILKSKGLSIGVIKSSHHDFEIDRPGKDSFRLRTAGGTPLMLVSPYRQVIISEYSTPQEINLADQLKAFPCSGLDLILVEGFRTEKFAKIELHRPLLGKPLLYPDDPDIIAIASDQPLATALPIPHLDINNEQAIGAFICGFFGIKAS
jgi:molybdopterin-guanine dinucleotide biosynthesis adapter protein